MMAKCDDHDFPCQSPEYDDFDKMAREELSQPLAANDLVNLSEYCMMIPVADDFVIGDLNHKLFLKPLKGQSGLYHLWTDFQSCDDHDTHTMLCAYVGKGPPDARIASHIKSKWSGGVLLYATFTRMNNRLAKYYEQLFLDYYHFTLNIAENSGSRALHAVWDSDRHHMGTHSNEVSSMSKIQSFDDW
jgi:hypothetical protein